MSNYGQVAMRVLWDCAIGSVVSFVYTVIFEVPRWKVVGKHGRGKFNTINKYCKLINSFINMYLHSGPSG
jgi:hypothetical protein